MKTDVINQEIKVGDIVVHGKDCKIGVVVKETAVRFKVSSWVFPDHNNIETAYGSICRPENMLVIKDKESIKRAIKLCELQEVIDLVNKNK